MKNFARSTKLASFCLLTGLGLAAQAATTDLAPAPLVTTPTSSVLPNVFLMMDDSGSMAWDYMPDNASNFSSTTYGAATSQCNGVFYNPAITYTPPVDATGASYPNSSFTAAWKDGYNTASGTTNLSTSFTPTGGGTAAAAYYYKYTGTQTTEKLKDYYNTASTFYKECNSAVGSAPGNGVFTKVTVSASSGLAPHVDELTNFANWYSYYRTRINMMKSATGQAFRSIGTSFRVGLATMNNNTGADFLPLDTFNTTQKSSFYSKLYATKPGSSTPLREALANVGRMYANKLPANNTNNALMNNAVVDPIQYSCQQNFTILTTDGFWNGSTTYDLAGNPVGNQDYIEPRPMYDGANVTQIITTPYTTVEQRKLVTTGVVTTNTWAGSINIIGAACTIPGTPPNLIASAPTSLHDSGNSGNSWSNSHLGGLATGSTAPSTRCTAIGTHTGSASDAWFCRGSGTSAPGFTTYTSVTDATPTTWFLVSSLTGNTNSANCVSSNTAFGYNSTAPVYACPGGTAAAGFMVTTTPYTLLETISGGTSTVINNYTANQQTTQTIANGIAGAVSALTPATPVFNLTSNVSTVTTLPTSDVFGAWVAGASSTPVCVATASLPAVWVWNTPLYTSSSTAGTTTTTILSTTGPTAGTPVTTTSSSGGTFDTLADVAEYYYRTDLRTVALGNNLSGAAGAVNGTDVSNNNVPSSGLDAASHQHMTTFTLGLGARGRMVFDPSYQTATTGDFYAVKQGSTASSTSGICTWQANNTICNWPIPASNAIENIDDLWHAAVNGRGTYFSAANSSDLAIALSSALAGVSARTGAAAAATTSNAFVTQGDNFLFRSTFVSQQWSGELVRQQLDINTGAVLSAIDWSAQAKLDANAARTIYFFDPASSIKLNTFAWANLGTLQSNFNLAHISTLTQFCVPYTVGGTCLSAADQTLASGSNLVSFLRGDRTFEGALTDNTKYYRQRSHVLGDIVNAESIYVRRAVSPSFSDLGYSSFATTVTNRQPMVYVAANDGMLHAFYAADGSVDPVTGNNVTTGGLAVTGGNEAWAFVPTDVMPNLYKLADKNYGVQHQYFVDGSPVVADVCVSSCGTNGSVWKTILVGGFNAGGKGYYAMDITNPLHPKGLWEFRDANMGYTFGNPKVVKLKTGQWVVLVTSGYNNVPDGTAMYSGADGVGRLYVIDAATGTLVNTISTGVGDTVTPSGLARIDAPLTTPGIDSTALAVYAGDLLGNVWRFDINGDIGAAGTDAQLLATLKDSAGVAQPITAKPLITLIGTNYVIYIGTGRYLGSSDMPITQTQSFYAIKETFPTGTTPSVAIYGNPRTQGSFIQQTRTLTTCPVGSPAKICTSGQTVVISSNKAVNFNTDNGWFFDFPLAGERVNTDPDIIDGTIVVNSNVPNASSCSVGGDSYQYMLDYRTGGAVSSSTTSVVAIKLSNELSTRPVVATLGSGSSSGGDECSKAKNIAYTQGSGGNNPTASSVWNNCDNNPPLKPNPYRRSWRELIRE